MNNPDRTTEAEGHDSTSARWLPFSLLLRVFGDPVMADIFGESKTIEAWLCAEKALAEAQAEIGLISSSDAKAITEAADVRNIDRDTLWARTREVGYPILPLIRTVSEVLPTEASGRLHYGATTQDIMDTGASLQLREALDRLESLLRRFGSAIAVLTEAHRDSVMAARTHGQQAVPTTFGAKMATFLDQASQHIIDLAHVRERVAVISLFGAGGTSAAMGPDAAEIRNRMAARLGLRTRDIPWHVGRSGLAEVAGTCGRIAATMTRWSREVIDLSRTEIGEVRERWSHHRGASSTMPQKANPVMSEATIGLASNAIALSAALYRAMEGGHERGAGEWQIEWHAIPQVLTLTSSSLLNASEVAEGLEVHPGVMRRNLGVDGGLLMSEAFMMALAPALGQAGAHDAVYDAVRVARNEAKSLFEVLRSNGSLPIELMDDIPPEGYLGAARTVCEAAISQWRGTEAELDQRIRQMEE